MKPSASEIRRAFSSQLDPLSAVREVQEALDPASAALVVLFVPAASDLAKLGEAIASEFGDAPTLACTTAGEISPEGYRGTGLTGFALPKGDFTVETECIDNLNSFEYRDGEAITAALRSRLEAKSPGVNGRNTFAFVLIDGLSRREEPLTAAVYTTLGDIQLFGGSAGDGSEFGETFLYWNGKFRTDRALITLVRTSRPFYVFRTQHFEASEVRMVVTNSDPSERTVYSIDGELATTAYARHLGISVAELNPTVFACNPVVVKMGGDYFVRSIMRHRPDGAIEFACAIDQGVVMRLARGVDMVQNLEQAFAGVEQRVGHPDLIIGCDCLFRRVEAESSNIQDAVSSILKRNNVVGFVTYGEQFNAAHVNQTLTGVAIGRREAA